MSPSIHHIQWPCPDAFNLNSSGDKDKTDTYECCSVPKLAAGVDSSILKQLETSNFAWPSFEMTITATLYGATILCWTLLGASQAFISSSRQHCKAFNRGSSRSRGSWAVCLRSEAKSGVRPRTAGFRTPASSQPHHVYTQTGCAPRHWTAWGNWKIPCSYNAHQTHFSENTELAGQRQRVIAAGEARR